MAPYQLSLKPFVAIRQMKHLTTKSNQSYVPWALLCCGFLSNSVLFRKKQTMDTDTQRLIDVLITIFLRLLASRIERNESWFLYTVVTWIYAIMI